MGQLKERSYCAVNHRVLKLCHEPRDLCGLRCSQILSLFQTTSNATSISFNFHYDRKGILSQGFTVPRSRTPTSVVQSANSEIRIECPNPPQHRNLAQEQTKYTIKMSLYTISDLPRISREKLATLVRSKSSSLAVIDVRDSDYIGGHIVNGINAPTHTHDYRMPELVRTLKDKETVVFHCALSQQRGPSSALRYLRERERLQSVDSKNSANADAVANAEGIKADPTKDGEGIVKNGQTVYVLEGGFVKWQEL